MKNIVFIDSMALAYKAHFAFISRPLRTKSGFPTSAIFGFVNQLAKIIDDIKPDSIIIAFDSPEKTFRHLAFEQYKAHRQEMPEDLQLQIPKLFELVDALGLPSYRISGFEADDIIGTLAKKASREGNMSYLVTPDKDYMQLVEDNILIVKPGKSAEPLSIYNVEKVVEEYGFRPEQMIDYLALIGDASDNIPGVAGIGPKTALPLIQKYLTVENIYEHLSEISSESLKKKLVESREIALVSKDLVTIKLDVPFDDPDIQFTQPAPDMERLRAFFTEYELTSPFTKMQKLFERFTPGTSSPAIEELLPPAEVFQKDTSNYKLITTTADCEDLAKKLSSVEEFVFDTETDGLQKFTSNLAGASFCFKEGEAYFVAVNPSANSGGLFGPDLSARLPIEEFVRILKPVFENPSIKKICHNAKFDISILKNYGINTKGLHFDTMVAAYIIDADQRLSMDELSEKYLNYRPIPLSELIGKKKQADKIFEVELETLSNYAAEDADVTFKLYQIFKKLIKDHGFEKVAYEVDFPLIETLEIIERNGVRLDNKSLKILSNDLALQMEIISTTVFNLAGETFNINSPLQMQKILFDKLKLKTAKKTKTGFSTDARTLEGLRGEHEIIEALLAYRQAAKLKSTYADALPLLIDPTTNKIHTTFNQTIAVTGRLSSVDPNLQNIPIRTEQGKEIRKAFVPSDKDYTILSADYSQIELRIMASMSNDIGMTSAFNSGEDIHRSTASQVFQIPLAEVTTEMRRRAKEVNFGILYGIGIFGLKTRLGITNQHAKEIIETYFNTFKNVKAFIDECTAFARKNGYAETLFGRRRYLPNISSSNFNVRQFEERVAVNMPIQGTAADMIKIAMINIQREIEKRKLKSRMTLQVHDELVFDAHKSEVDELKSFVKPLMESALPLNVPVIVDMGVGDNWLDAH